MRQVMRPRYGLGIDYPRRASLSGASCVFLFMDWFDVLRRDFQFRTKDFNMRWSFHSNPYFITVNTNNG